MPYSDGYVGISIYSISRISILKYRTVTSINFLIRKTALINSWLSDWCHFRVVFFTVGQSTQYQACWWQVGYACPKSGKWILARKLAGLMEGALNYVQRGKRITLSFLDISHGVGCCCSSPDPQDNLNAFIPIPAA